MLQSVHMPENVPIDRQDVESSISDLWRYYDEHAAQARQHETLRATVTSILAGFAATVVGIVTGHGLTRQDILPGALIVALGVIGGALSLKHYERNRFHTTMLGVIRDEITRLRTTPLDATPLSTHALRRKGTKKHEAEFGRRKAEKTARNQPDDKRPSALVRARLFVLWLALPLTIVLAGVIVVIVAAT